MRIKQIKSFTAFNYFKQPASPWIIYITPLQCAFILSYLCVLFSIHALSSTVPRRVFYQWRSVAKISGYAGYWFTTRNMRARRAATQNFGETLDTLVPLTARHCFLRWLIILKFDIFMINYLWFWYYLCILDQNLAVLWTNMVFVKIFILKTSHYYWVFVWR